MLGESQTFAGNHSNVPAKLPSASGEPVAVIPMTDPFETAYLRGGEREVLKLALFDLVEQGYLEIRKLRQLLSDTHQLVLSPHHPPLASLDQANRELLDHFAEPLGITEISKIPLPAELQSACLGYEERLQQLGLLSRPSKASALSAYSAIIFFIVWIVAALILHPFAGFVIAVVVATLFDRVLVRRRLTDAGRKALQQLQKALAQWKDHPKSARLDIHETALVPLVAVLGPQVLTGSVYDAFAKATGGTSPAWQISFDAGCGSDGGCGGDGGGCGGCGCG